MDEKISEDSLDFGTNFDWAPNRSLPEPAAISVKKFARHLYKIPGDLVSRLDKASRNDGVEASSFLLAAFTVVLNRYVQDDLSYIANTQSSSKDLQSVAKHWMRIGGNLPRWIGANCGPENLRETLKKGSRRLLYWTRRYITRGKTEYRFEDEFGARRSHDDRHEVLSRIFQGFNAYRPEPYGDRVTLFRASVRPLLHNLSPDLGWSSVAQKAISLLGVTPTAIVIGDGREPVWPVGIVGSITHCSGYCAAVAAKSSQVLSIGIDAEENLPLPEGVWELIASNQQPSALAHHSEPLICYDRLLFCAKEAVYKAWYSITKQSLDFSECHILWDPCQLPRSLTGGLICGGFVAELKRPCRVDRRQIDEFQGRYIASPSHLATLVQVR